MVRIAQGIWPEEIQERNYFTSRGEYKVDKDAYVFPSSFSVSCGYDSGQIRSD
jgi:hypothetical protein